MAERDRQSAPAARPPLLLARHRGRADRCRAGSRHEDGLLLLRRAGLELQPGADRPRRGGLDYDPAHQGVRRLRGRALAGADPPVRSGDPVERHRLPRAVRPGDDRGGLLQRPRGRSDQRPVRDRQGGSAQEASRLRDSGVRQDGRDHGPQVGDVPGPRLLVRLQPGRDRGAHDRGGRADSPAGRHCQQERESSPQCRPDGRRHHSGDPGQSAPGVGSLARNQWRGHLRHAALGASRRGDGGRNSGPVHVEGRGDLRHPPGPAGGAGVRTGSRSLRQHCRGRRARGSGDATATYADGRLSVALASPLQGGHAHSLRIRIS